MCEDGGEIGLILDRITPERILSSVTKWNQSQRSGFRRTWWIVILVFSIGGSLWLLAGYPRLPSK
jgi:hypothetical protein